VSKSSLIDRDKKKTPSWLITYSRPAWTACVPLSEGEPIIIIINIINIMIIIILIIHPHHHALSSSLQTLIIMFCCTGKEKGDANYWQEQQRGGD